MSAMLMASGSDVVIGLAVGIPVVVIGGGTLVALRLRGRAGKSVVPPGEVVSDAPTDIELAKSAEATRRAADKLEPPASGTVTTAPDELLSPAEAEVIAPTAEPEPVEPLEVVEPPTYRGRLGKARGLLAGYLGSVRAKGKIDASTWDDLEEALIRADVGVGATDLLLDDLRARVKSGSITGTEGLVDALKGDLIEALTTADARLAVPGAGSGGPSSANGDGPASADVGEGAPADGAPRRSVDVWLFVGVNGVGKTTTVGKVASRLAGSGERVLLAAGDTFRAAAGEQLAMWASRADADIVQGAEGSDPSSVVFDAVQRADAKGHSLVLADTAGRLHNKVNLIEELKKIRRVADRPPGQVTEVLLVLDATTGQNGLAQAKVFTEAVDVSGVVLTKLDGTAKGGIVVAIQRELGLPVKLVGLGEGIADLVDFDPVAFVDALF
ncbi:MAG TPA: signal recognition particle-docking protein FtsY [Acidimicrobiales bacterium]|nr:signal recognition particle-docking protein FtsY [Acidimicrobiales bacterium]